VSQIWVFLALAFSILIAIFAVQNNTPVEVRFLVWGPAEVPVSVLVLISTLVGAAVMLLLGLNREVRLRWRQRHTAQELRAAQRRVAELEAKQPPPAPSAAPLEEEATPSPHTAP
jgi:uncharacterized integral membrane protein